MLECLATVHFWRWTEGRIRSYKSIHALYHYAKAVNDVEQT